jgi:hypothetical protein
MSVDNAHHEFEHLCRHLARRRLCSNIIPATGPVAGGGDQGADFESIQLLSDFGTSRYWQLIQTGQIVFACSLEKNLKKKVKADLKSAANRTNPTDWLYFFYPEPVKVSVRNALKEFANQQYKIQLEILDSVAIAEFLADPEMLWIAERYLSLPSGISLPGPNARNNLNSVDHSINQTSQDRAGGPDAPRRLGLSGLRCVAEDNRRSTARSNGNCTSARYSVRR